MIVDGIKTRTEPLDFEVFNPDDLQWSEVQSGEQDRSATPARSGCMNPTPL